MSEIVDWRNLQVWFQNSRLRLPSAKSQSTKNELRIAELTDRETEAMERLAKLQEKCTSLSADAATQVNEFDRGRCEMRRLPVRPRL